MHKINYISESELRLKGYTIIAGVDEAGRGPLAGPVVACAVALPIGFFDKRIKDSKKLSPVKREEILPVILSNAVSFGIGVVSHDIIDSINILEANKLAMKEAVLSMNPLPNFVIIDGRDKIDISIEQMTAIKGDSIYQSVSAASIAAKVLRDQIMLRYHDLFPEYNFASHKGYGTKLHIDSIKKYGISPIHRRSFVKNILSTQNPI